MYTWEERARSVQQDVSEETTEFTALTLFRVELSFR